MLYHTNETTAAERRVFIHLVDATDGITPETGEAAGQPQLSVNGAAFANTTATLTAVGNGTYYVELTAVELNFQGHGIVRYKSAATAEAQVCIQVVPWNVFLDFTTTIAATQTSVGTGLETKVDTVDTKVDRNADLIESQRGAHTWSGNHYHVDPVNGNDSTGDGSRALPYATVQAAHDDLVTDSNHDVIFLVPGAAAGVTTLTDDVTLSKRYLLIRGPGRDFIWTRSGNGDTISITADGVELSGFQLETAATGSGNGVQITDADFIRVHNLWINATQGDGINILRGDNCQIHDDVFTDTGQGGSGQGIHIIGTAGDSNYNIIYNNSFRDCAGDGVKIESGTTLNTHIFNNHIEGSTGWGINIGASSTDAFVTANTFGNNASGAITDAGTTSVLENNEQWATSTALAVVDTNVDAILVDTGTTLPVTLTTIEGKIDTVDTVVDGIATQIGTAGDGLTALPISDANVTQINGVAAAAVGLSLSADAIENGTASGTPTGTTMISDIGITVDDQFLGRNIIFADDTTTAGLRGAATDITACTASTNTLTFTALPATPVSGDTFIIT